MDLLSDTLNDQFDKFYDALEAIAPLGGPACVERHCSHEVNACLADWTCRENFICAGGCQGEPDQDNCTYLCSQSYMGETIDHLEYCMFEEHECIPFPEPAADNNATCREPLDLVVDGVNRELVQGTWQIQYGFNPDYDCFACQLCTYDFAKDEPITYSAVYDLTAVNGTHIWNSVLMRGTEDIPGVFTLTDTCGGLTDVQRWFFLINEEDLLMAYYFGTLMTWRFEGVVILTKSGSIDPHKEPLITAKLEGLGLGWSDLCKLNPEQNCKSAPVNYV